jgi:transcriptional regulatory protein LevR
MVATMDMPSDRQMEITRRATEKKKPRKRTEVTGAMVLAFMGRSSSMRRMLTTRTECGGRLPASLQVRLAGN